MAPAASDTSHITVIPAEFHLVSYDAEEIQAIIAEMAGHLGVSNPVQLVVDETTPNAKLSAQLDTASSDTTIVIHAESGALENTRDLTTFGPDTARSSIGRMLLRARDRMRDDFADAPADLQLSNPQNAAWDAYCAGRLARLDGSPVPINKQRWRYNFRNRFGFDDRTDAHFERLWNAEDLGWSDLIGD